MYLHMNIFMRVYVYIYIYIYYRSMDQHKYMYTCRCKHCEHGIVLDHFLTHLSRLRKWVSSATWMRFYTFLRLGNLHKRYEIALGNPPKLVTSSFMVGFPASHVGFSGA